MMAAHDKVQSILQTLLQNNLPLIHKGIFTSSQVQQAMCQRQKLQNNMLKPTYKLSDYLKAIQFQYTLQRKRRSRIQSDHPTHPLFKKQTKTDFVLIKRIISLWNRTMHKFKFNIQLWKQYLDFCIKIQSKKQFYKALSASLRFLPFAEELWLIGVRYEIQIGCNLWKARKIFIKALKMNAKNTHLWIQMFKFQIQFLQTLSKRQRVIKGNQTLQFIGSNSNNDNSNEEQSEIMIQENKNKQIIADEEMNSNQEQIKLEQHDDILVMVYQQGYASIQQVNKTKFKQTVDEIIQKTINDTTDKLVLQVMKKVKQRISSGSITSDHNKTIMKEQKKLSTPTIPSNIQEKLQHSKSYITSNTQLSNQQLDKIVGQFLMKPVHLSHLLAHLLKQNQQRAIEYLKTTKRLKIQHLPPPIIHKLIQALAQNQAIQTTKFLSALIKKLSTNLYIQYPNLLQPVIKFNIANKNYKANVDIHRTISILCKNKPQIVEKCLNYINQFK